MDAIEPIGSAVTAYTYDNTSLIGCISYEGDYKLAYFSFPVEAISGLNYTIPRHELVENIFNWFEFVNVQDIENISLPTDFVLKQNFPNPFNPATQIEFALPYSSMITLKVYNSAGREVAVLANDVYEAGYHQVEFDGTELSSGLYFVNMQSGDISITHKMLLVK